jgi:hypothetical protein
VPKAIVDQKGAHGFQHFAATLGNRRRVKWPARLAQAPAGAYSLIRKGEIAPEHARVYRLTHPLGQYVLDYGHNLARHRCRR